jgi:hypothetical protein
LREDDPTRHGLSLFLGEEETMNKHSILSISAITALGLVLYSSSAVAQSAKDIVGPGQSCRQRHLAPLQKAF